MLYPSFFTFNYTFFQKTPFVECPRLDVRGRRPPRHPLCTPLDNHKTAWNRRRCTCVSIHGQQKDAVGVSLESSFSDYCGVDPCNVVFRSPNDIMGGDLGVWGTVPQN